LSWASLLLRPLRDLTLFYPLDGESDTLLAVSCSRNSLLSLQGIQ
jgi:hypothetical protein